MANTVQVTAADRTTLIVDLNDGTNVLTIWFHPGDPVTDETWFFPDTASGGTLATALDRPRRATLAIAIKAQASADALTAKAEAIRNAFLTTGNWLKYQPGAGTAKFYPLIASRLSPFADSEEEHRTAIIYNQATRWDLSFWVGPYAFGDTKIPIR